MRAMAAILAGCGGMFLGVTSAEAAPYRLEIIAQVGDVIDGRTIDRFSFDPTNVAINNDGEVAFFAGVVSPEGVGYAVMTQRRFIAGAGKLVDATYPRFNNEDHQVDINNRGEVVYTAYLPGGRRGLFVNEDLRFRTGDEVDGRVISLVGHYSSINDSGTVAFDGWHTNDTVSAVFTQSEVLAESGQVLDGYTFGAMGFPRIGNGGDIAYFVGLTETDRLAIASPTRIHLKQDVDRIDGKNVGSINAIGTITETGAFPLTLSLGDYPDWQYYVVMGDGVLFRQGDVIAGERVIGLWGTNTVLNNRGELALLGAVARQEGVLDEVLFAGGRIVASRGDTIDGNAIAKIFPNFDMNDLGDVAFRVEFADGSRAVVLATVPEPTTWSLVATCSLALALKSRRRMRSKS